MTPEKNPVSMTLDEFQSYRNAVQFYFQCEKVRCPEPVRRNLLLSSSSVALTLAEAATVKEGPERTRLRKLALDFVRESQALFNLISRVPQSLVELAEKLDESLGYTSRNSRSFPVQQVLGHNGPIAAARGFAESA